MDLDIERVPVVHSAQYDLAGVYSFGRGLFRRGPLSGAATSYGYLHRLHTDQFVMSKLKAWEGALTVVDEGFDGWVLSPEFPTYEVRQDALDPDYALLLTTQPAFWASVAAQSRGMGGRKERVHQDRLLNVEVDLPPVAEQRRIVDLLGSVDAVLGTALAAVAANSSVRGAVLAELFADGDEAELGELIELVYGRALPERARTGDGYPVYGAAGMVGRHNTPDLADGPVIIVGRKGVHARASVRVAPRTDEALAGIDGYRGEGGAGTIRWSSSPCTVIDTAFRALPKRPMDLRLLFWVLRVADLPSLTTKTTLPGLSREVAARVRVVVPQFERAAPLIDLLDALDEVLIAGYKRAACLQSVRSALLAELLSGDHEMPASYDRFLNGAA